MAARQAFPKARTLDVDAIDFDPMNPRLVVPPDVSQALLLEQLYEQESLDELVTSFVENGYFQEEPLVVVKEGERYFAVEGNRRLATIKLLLDPALRRRAQVGGWPSLSATQRARLESVPCVEYENRHAVLPFLGFRHITGAKKWRPFQRARFVAQLLEGGESLDEIEQLIGDSTSATKKLYQDYVIFRQITEELNQSGDLVRQRFSLLEVALGQRSIKTFLGLGPRLPQRQVDRLVPTDRLDALEELTSWIFGDDSSSPVIDESRDINARLAKVIGNDEALTHLRLTRDLEAAYERTDGEQQYLLRRLAAAERAVQTASGLISLYAKQPDVKTAVERLTKVVSGLSAQLQ